jgi:ethanolamine ammonia-lyase small subunit
VAGIESHGDKAVQAGDDVWVRLRQFTPARIGLGRVGGSLPTQALLDFELAHARARDAAQAGFDAEALARELRDTGLGEATIVASRARDRREYLLRPDLGRALDAESRQKLGSWNPASGQNRATRSTPLPLTSLAQGRSGQGHGAPGFRCDLAVVIADGLSAVAPARHAAPLLREFMTALGSNGNKVTVVVANRGRVALGDEIGELLGAEAAVVLIGERPGLSSPDSLGVYLTWAPRVGRTDAERNCISNVRLEGLAYQDAAKRLAYLVCEARRLKLSGVALKDDCEAEGKASERRLAKGV